MLGVIGATGAYWWFVLVPSARVRLAANKKSGSLRRYLEELKAGREKIHETPARRCVSAGSSAEFCSRAGEGRRVEKWFYANWLTKIDPETKYLLRNDTEDPGRSASPTTVQSRHCPAALAAMPDCLLGTAAGAAC